ncbi:MAG: LysR family transcriptional regulator [Leptolyngbyaceae cyanobacterium MO_188.B28]|nr:LysR family transcriptional regulator [Leptolyngbyaceae cyanobacterium MO_188.B28]
MTIDYTNLRKLDLNLLLALDVLIEEASVTKAAERLNMSQSSMSHALKRLRSLLGDPILIRTSRDMEVTPYAREISVSIRQALTNIQGALFERDPFNPNAAREDFRIAASDYVEATLGGNLLQQLTNRAPGVRIRVSNLDRATVLDALDDNSVDLFIDVDLPRKSWHVKQDLYQEEFVCVVDSRCAATEISLEDYLKRSHVLVSMRNDFHGAADQVLAQQQHTRNVIWSTTHFMAVPFLIINSDCMALLPKRMAQKCARSMGLTLLPPPIDVVGFTVSMFWHQRNNNLPEHQWLRNQLMEAARTL